MPSRRSLPISARASIPSTPTTAVFYSISNCQRGLAGVTFGNFLIKQVVEEISRDNPRLSTIRDVVADAEFRRVAAARALERAVHRARRAKIARRSKQSRYRRLVAGAGSARAGARAADARRRLLFPACDATRAARPIDAVARFHLGNGARLEQINFLGDTSEKGIRQAHGMMVNYLYDLEDIEKNHEAYAQNRAIAASSAREAAGARCACRTRAARLSHHDSRSPL